MSGASHYERAVVVVAMLWSFRARSWIGGGGGGDRAGRREP